MTLAWYGHLKLEEMGLLKKTGLFAVVFLSWGLALFEYLFQVPANKFGFDGNGGPFTLFQLKVLQEVITLTVFFLFARLAFKSIEFNWNHFYAALCLIAAVYFVFKK